MPQAETLSSSYPEDLERLAAAAPAIGDLILDSVNGPTQELRLPTFSTKEEARAVFGRRSRKDFDFKTFYRTISEDDLRRILREGEINSNFSGSGQVPERSVSVGYDPGDTAFEIASKHPEDVMIAFEPSKIVGRWPQTAIAAETPSDRIVGAARFAPPQGETPTPQDSK